MNVYVTQRMDIFPPHGERRDSIDVCWHKFFEDVGITPILIPNNLNFVKSIMGKIKGDGLILTGGNTLQGLEGADAPERDLVEKALLEYFLEKELPVIGVCRGFQFIHQYLGGELIRVDNYAGKEHEVTFEDGKKKGNDTL